MMQAAAAVMGTGAVAGLVLAALRSAQPHPPPAALALLHGLVMAAGLALLLYAAAAIGVPRPAQAACAVLLAAALAGVALRMRLPATGRVRRSHLMLGHMLVAALGLGLLLVVLIRPPSA
jgi:hypothetical protein